MGIIAVSLAFCYTSWKKVIFLSKVTEEPSHKITLLSGLRLNNSDYFRSISTFQSRQWNFQSERPFIASDGYITIVWYWEDCLVSFPRFHSYLISFGNMLLATCCVFSYRLHMITAWESPCFLRSIRCIIRWGDPITRDRRTCLCSRIICEVL